MGNDIHREIWQSLGASDPDWSVLTTKRMRGGGWTKNMEAFYATGRSDLADVVSASPEPRYEHALDWGAGTGRLSFALAEHFERVTSIDVADTMLALLAQRADERGVTNVAPTHLDAFRPDGTVDLALSLLVLQHLPNNEAIDDALRKMVQALRPGGLICVEIPASALTVKTRLQPHFQAYRLLRHLGLPASTLQARGLSGISMLWCSEEHVRGVLESAGAEVVNVVERPGRGYRFLRYIGRRRGLESS